MYFLHLKQSGKKKEQILKKDGLFHVFGTTRPLIREDYPPVGSMYF